MQMFKGTITQGKVAQILIKQLNTKSIRLVYIELAIQNVSDK